MSYQTVIFDLDGTLLNTLDDLADSVDHALREMGWPPRSLAEIRQFVGNGVALLVERAVPAGTDPADAETCLALFKAHYALHMKDKTAPYPGVLDLLDALRESGLSTAVVSNKFDAAVKGLCGDYFGARIQAAAGESATAPKKPDPAMVRRALSDLGASADGAVYVGDSDVDIATAKNAGIPCVSVTWGFRNEDFLRAHGATRVVHSPEELGKVLLEG